MRLRMGFSSCFLAAVCLLALSCGGDVARDGVVGSSPAQAVPTTDPAAVSVTAQVQMQAICHYDAETGTISDLRVPAPAVAAHLGHGDASGTCAAACPCFVAADFASAVATCKLEASYGLFCASDPEINNGLVVNQVVCPGVPQPPFVYTQTVDTRAHTCSREEKVSGATTVTSANLSPVQEAACRQIIVDHGNGICVQ